MIDKQHYNRYYIERTWRSMHVWADNYPKRTRSCVICGCSEKHATIHCIQERIPAHKLFLIELGMLDFKFGEWI